MAGVLRDILLVFFFRGTIVNDERLSSNCPDTTSAATLETHTILDMMQIKTRIFINTRPVIIHTFITLTFPVFYPCSSALEESRATPFPAMKPNELEDSSNFNRCGLFQLYCSIRVNDRGNRKKDRVILYSLYGP